MINGLSNKDRVRVFLNSQGQLYVPVGKLSDLATKADMEATPFYQALHALQRQNEVEVETDVIAGSNRRVIVGIKIKKLATLPTIAAHGEIVKQKPSKTEVSVPKLPNITQYMHQKNVLDNIAEKLVSEGFAPDAIQINFEPNPLAEEAITILDLLGRASKAIASMEIEKNEYKAKADRLEAMIKQQIPQGAEILAPKHE